MKNVLLDKRPDVQYIISQSYTDEKYKYVPEELLRDDILITQIPEKGVSHSVNVTIKMANADIAVFFDDDLSITDQNIDSIITLTENESLDCRYF